MKDMVMNIIKNNEICAFCSNNINIEEFHIQALDKNGDFLGCTINKRNECAQFIYDPSRSSENANIPAVKDYIMNDSWVIDIKMRDDIE